jgi:D-sedoheptulose 7-phosphate isomerase
MKETIVSQLKRSAELKLQNAEALAVSIGEIAMRLAECLKAGGTVYLMGNGGSAADAQHIACELVGRYREERKAMRAVALTTDTSVLTSVSNDYGFDDVFRRQVEGLVRKGDAVVGFSTSGGSANVIRACERARDIGATVVGFSGRGGKLKEVADVCLTVPEDETPRIQEVHITAGHIICGLVEEMLSE